MKKLLYLFAFVLFYSCSSDEPCEPFPILATDDATDLTDVSATIFGSITPPTCEDTVTSQGFVYSKTTLPKTDDLVIEKTGANISATVTNLEQNTTYYIRTFFENPTGVYYGNQVIFTTAVGNALISLSNIRNITVNSVEANVSISSSGGGNISNKGICYSTSEQPTIDGDKVEAGSGSDAVSVTIQGLTNYTVYYLRAFVVNESGVHYSDQQSFTTRDGVGELTTNNVTVRTTTTATSGGNITDNGGFYVNSKIGYFDVVVNGGYQINSTIDAVIYAYPGSVLQFNIDVVGHPFNIFKGATGNENEVTFTINSQNITANKGNTVSQGVATGILHSTLNGSTTSFVIISNNNTTFNTNDDIIIQVIPPITITGSNINNRATISASPSILQHVTDNGIITKDAAAQAQTSGTLMWFVPYNVIGDYRYQCSNHSTEGMHGLINILPMPSDVSANDISGGNIYTNTLRSNGIVINGNISGNTATFTHGIINTDLGIGTSTPSVSLDIIGTDAIRIPVGTTAQKPSGQNGYIRYNITDNQFEGYSSGAWAGLGGVIDKDLDTKILAEFGGNDEDKLRFYTEGTERMIITDSDNSGNIGIGTQTPSVTLDISSNNAIRLPMGNNNMRPSNADASGCLRYNTETKQFEGYGEGSWGGLGGVISLDMNTKITAEDTGGLTFFTDEQKRMNIANNGKIDISSAVIINNNLDCSSAVIKILTSDSTYVKDLSCSELDISGILKTDGLIINNKTIVKNNITDNGGFYVNSKIGYFDVVVNGGYQINSTIDAVIYAYPGSVLQFNIDVVGHPFNIFKGATGNENEVTFTINSQNITANKGNTVSQGVATGILHSTLNGSTTSFVIISNNNTTFNTNDDIIIQVIPPITITGSNINNRATISASPSILQHVTDNGIITKDAAAQAQTSGTLMWFVPYNVIGDYRYQCSNHSTEGMHGLINILPMPSDVSANDISGGNIYTNTLRSNGIVINGNISGNTATFTHGIINTDLGIGTSTPSVSLDIIGTDAIRIPVGTTAQKPSGQNGYIRYNITDNQFEGYSSGAWAGLGGVIDKDLDTKILADISGNNDNKLRFITQGTEKMIITDSDNSGNIGIGTQTPSVTLDISSNNAIRLPMGNTNEQPSDADARGCLRYNTETKQFEGYGEGSWGGLGGVISIDMKTKITALDTGLTFFTDGQKRMNIASNGNIDISSAVFINNNLDCSSAVIKNLTSDSTYVTDLSCSELDISGILKTDGLIINNKTIVKNSIVADHVNKSGYFDIFSDEDDVDDYDVNGFPSSSIYAYPGSVLQFNLDGVSSTHPFNIFINYEDSATGTSPSGLQHVADDGTITNNANGKYDGSLIWFVPYDAIGFFRYQCGTHEDMNGLIEILPMPSDVSANDISGGNIYANTLTISGDLSGNNAFLHDVSVNRLWIGNVEMIGHIPGAIGDEPNTGTLTGNMIIVGDLSANDASFNVVDTKQLSISASSLNFGSGGGGDLRYESGKFQGHNGSNWIGLGGVVSDNEEVKITAHDTNGLQFYTANVQRMQILNNGNITIDNDLTVTGSLSGTVFTASQPNITSVGTLTGLAVTSPISGSINGNAATATILQNTRTIGDVSFDGSADINLPGVNQAGNQDTTGSSGLCTGNAASASQVYVTNYSTGDFRLCLCNGVNINANIRSGGEARYDPGTNVLTAGTFLGNVTGNVTGDVTGNADSATNATTHAIGTDSTQIATTAYVKSQNYITNIADAFAYSYLSGKPTNITHLTNNAGYITNIANAFAYSNLSGRPFIPTHISQLSNNSGYITSVPTSISISNLQGTQVGTKSITVNSNTYFKAAGGIVVEANGHLSWTGGSSNMLMHYSYPVTYYKHSYQATVSNLALRTPDVIYCGSYLIASDKRIKENIRDVSDNIALQTLRDVSCCFYEYKDKITRGFNTTIGFIAQQVREQFPIAVSLIKEIIPNELRDIENPQWTPITDSSGNKYKLTIPDLQDVSGTKYKFYVSNDPSGNDECKKEIFSMENDPKSFIFEEQWQNVFLYGKEIDDFHSLDKAKLFALNFSATQEIDKVQQAEKTKLEEQTSKLEEHITKLMAAEAKIVILETKNQDLETKLTNLIDQLKANNTIN